MKMSAGQDRIPTTQYAVQLTGPGRLTLNRNKPLPPVGPYTILARVEAVGLCFSDLKMLKQFAAHPRKGEIVSGLPGEVLGELAGYVPGDLPTVPGHEAVCRIVAVGGRVSSHKAGERVIVQTDYRSLRTAGSNAAFGYNFEGALQEYVAMDERVVVDAETGERFLIPAGEDLSASAACLVEPWACVEDSYASPERRSPQSGGNMLVVAELGHGIEGLSEACGSGGKPAEVVAVCTAAQESDAARDLGVPVTRAADAAGLPAEAFDDIVYFGERKETIEALNDKLAQRGIMNIVTRGRRIGHSVSVGVGRVHYGLTRWIGTHGHSAAESYRSIPATGEIRPGEKILVVGAAGPMGQMHVIRCITSGVPGIEITAADVDDARLAALERKAGPLAKARGVKFLVVNPQKEPSPGAASYVAIMAPVPSLVARAVNDGGEGCLVNVFAGIPAAAREPVDLDAYIAKRCFMFGTSGSVVRDMKIVLAKIESGQLDTNTSVDAVCGMEGAIEALAAVERRTLSGKIVVYPALRGLGLVPLADLRERAPSVAAKLNRDVWTKEAEEELYRVFGR